MLLTELVETSRAVGRTPSRTGTVEILARALRRLDPREAPIGLAYLTGELPQGRIGLGGAALGEALEAAPGAAQPSLTLREVDEAFGRIAIARGGGSAAERRRLAAALFSRAVPGEREFLARLVLGELRQGALEGLMVEAVARATGAPIADVRRAVMVAGDLAVVAAAALGEGPAALHRYSLEVMKPVRPMLAQTAVDVEAALAALGEAEMEFKLDGARVQVHKSGGDVRVFTRSLRDVTPAVPEVVAAIRGLPARSLILDGEALAVAPDGTPRPFQVTMRRFGRKNDQDRLRRELPLSAFFFDALHLEGEDLVARPAGERFAALESAVPPDLVVPRIVTGDSARAAAFLEESVRRGHEGVMAKSLAAPYEAGNRGSSWLKVKPARTLDLVVLAAEWGHGRRAGWLSNLHLGARDPATGGYAMLGKTFKGMSDEMLAWQTERLRALEVATDGHTVHVRPELVVEVAFDGLQASARYASGLALRFARVKRYRLDKSPSDADDIETVRVLYRADLARSTHLE